MPNISITGELSGIKVPEIQQKYKAHFADFDIYGTLNLVNNALKYSQDRKYIGVNLYRENGNVNLEVVDHGIGIPSQEQHKIFEKFYRVGDPLVHNTKGSGLGLSLVRHIVEAHGGRVGVDSTPGEGSKFTIRLPIDSANGGTASPRSE